MLPVKGGTAGITITPPCADLEAEGLPIPLSSPAPRPRPSFSSAIKKTPGVSSTFPPGMRLNIWQKGLPIWTISTVAYCDLTSTD